MGKIRICDRCSKTLEKQQESVFGDIMKRDTLDGFCRRCKIEFEDWLEAGRKKK